MKTIRFITNTDTAVTAAITYVGLDSVFDMGDGGVTSLHFLVLKNSSKDDHQWCSHRFHNSVPDDAVPRFYVKSGFITKIINSG